MSSDIPPRLEPELLNDFYEECDEHLTKIRTALVSLEGSVDMAQPDALVIEELFRNFHSLKGISAIVGLGAAEALAHASEDYLRGLTRGELTLSAGALDKLMAATQKLEQIVGAFRAGDPIPKHLPLVANLSTLCGKQTPEENTPVHQNIVSTPEIEGNAEMEVARGRGNILWLCTFTPSRELDARGINIQSVRARLSAVGQILQAKPLVRGQGALSFEFLLATRETPSDITKWEADGLKVELAEASTALVSPASENASHPRLAEPGHNPFIAPSHIVRVDLNRLDELMRITGEMVIQRSRFDEQINQAARGSASLDLGQLREVNLALTRSVAELREAVMRVRLVPVAEIFARMPFVVRDLARETQKRARLVLEGQQTEVDKYLIEQLKDPLLHLVRNAFSHGVETPEERAALAKAPEATIRLCASTEGDTVKIQIEDDGRGIDSEAVASRARSLGLLVPPLLDGAGLLQILCTPGFSTRDDADRVAGRGVGMAVVQNAVRKLGGTLSVKTTEGAGTQFTLRMPLTLAIAETFILSAAGQVYALPQSFVAEVLQIGEDEVRWVNRVEVIPYRGGLLPVVRLANLFGLATKGRSQMSVLVLNSERGRSGLMVDQIQGQREVVVRAMRDPLIQVAGIAGATELGDGRPVLILDGTHLTEGPVRPHDLMGSN